MIPKTAAPGKPWAWRAEFFGTFDSVDRYLLEKGFHLAYHRVSNRYGDDQSILWMKQFHDGMTEAFGLSQKAALFGFSRGGLYSINYAVKHPEDVGVLYLDAPVVDLFSWPAGLGKGEGDPPCWQQCKEIFSVAGDRPALPENPIDRIPALAKSGIPLVICAGDSDTAVPYEENGLFLEQAYGSRKDFLLLLKHGCGHHPHSMENPRSIADFVLCHTE